VHHVIATWCLLPLPLSPNLPFFSIPLFSFISLPPSIRFLPSFPPLTSPHSTPPDPPTGFKGPTSKGREGEGGQGSGGEGRVFFIIFKHSWAPKGSWKISHRRPWKVLEFFVSKRVGTLPSLPSTPSLTPHLPLFSPSLPPFLPFPSVLRYPHPPLFPTLPFPYFPFSLH